MYPKLRFKVAFAGTRIEAWPVHTLATQVTLNKSVIQESIP